MKISDLSNKLEPDNYLVAEVRQPLPSHYTLDEIADKVAELALVKVLAKLEQLSGNGE